MFILVPTQYINGLTHQTLSDLLPNSASNYTITPSNSKITISNSGDLMTTLLDSNDSGTYTVTSSDFGGAVFLVDISVYGK